MIRTATLFGVLFLALYTGNRFIWRAFFFFIAIAILRFISNSSHTAESMLNWYHRSHHALIDSQAHHIRSGGVTLSG